MRRSLLSVFLLCAPLGCVDSTSGEDPNAAGGDVSTGAASDTPGSIDDDSTSGPGAGDDATTGTDGTGTDGTGTDGTGTDGTGTDGTGPDAVVGPPICGDGSCTGDETIWSCAKDCGGGWFTCALEPCSDGIAACKASADCAAALNCIAPCTTDACASTCTDGLSDKTFGALRAVQQCAGENGCFGAVPTVCGNQQCEAGETAKSCPADCDKGCGNGTCDANETTDSCPTDCPKSPVYTCAEKACPDELAQCANTDGCFDFDKCLKGCAGDQQCSGQCFQNAPQGAPQVHQALVQCAQQAGCFNQGPVCGDGKCEPNEQCPEDCQAGSVCGDGVCDPGENCPPDCQVGPGDGSCVGICGEYSPSATCQCDDQCVQAGDCCKDYASVCGGTGGCGDGQCDPNTEDATTCPVDCSGSNDPYTCIVDSCGASQCTQGPKCNAALQCMAGCKDAACVDQCVAQAPNQLQGFLGQIGDCAVTTCLGGAGAECGDGQCTPGEEQTCPFDCFNQPNCGDAKCDPGETPQNCPKDCTGAVTCGDGVCTAPSENLFTCPKDCSGSTIVCGDGQCSAPFETEQTCPEDCGQTPGSCVGRCGQYDPNASCQCDNVCAFMGNCCGDLQAVCQGDACGDGTCDPSTEDAANCPADCASPPGSCAGRCSEYDPNATCQCDDFCVFAGNCCGDRDAVCSSTGCGDGFCDQNTESMDTCPADCAPVTPWQCVEQTCGFGNCQNFSGCNKALGCIDACAGDQACSKLCVSAAPSGAQSFLTQLVACAQQSGCYDTTTPVCGDGTCDASESFFTCPADCKPPFAFCGDGVCDSTESYTTCPTDCPPPKPVCGDGQCDATESYTTCPKDCPPPKPFCGDGTCDATESYTTCPSDCKAPPAECGNQICETGESFTTCPADCQDPSVCTYQQCPTEINACITDITCVQGLQCMAKCAGDAACIKQGCLASSAGTLNPLLLNIYMCATANQCIK